MDSAIAVSLQGVGKRYRLGSTASGLFNYNRLSDTLADLFKRSDADAARKKTFWALRDVSAEISKGEIVGIIGRNGAGKTTILKILSRITEPTEGRVALNGTVGALLEVGTGFHPELSGRENIFLNGAILGMKKKDIEQRFDDIVAFAEIDEFLDTPVKRYSSGMYVRLAFAVAAHLEPEILIVDEVLAVGDAEFQKKCLGRMQQIGSSGRTVLFVSHSMPTVLRLCDRVLLMDKGRLIDDGRPSEIVRKYLDSGLGSSAERVWNDPVVSPGDSVARLRSIRVLSKDRVTADVMIEDPVEVEVLYAHLPGADPALKPSVNLHFYNEDGVCLFVTNDFHSGGWANPESRGNVIRSVCNIPGNFLAEGRIFVLAAISSYNPTVVHAIEQDAVSFQVLDRTSGEGVRGGYANDWPGVVRPMLNWSVEPVEPVDASSIFAP